MIRGYDHTSFTVADIDRAVVFWRDVMGFALGDLSAREGDWLGSVVGVSGRQLPDRPPPRPRPAPRVRPVWNRGDRRHRAAAPSGTAHLAFLVEEIETAARRMLEGGASEQGRISRCSSGAAVGCLAVYLKDPDGIIVELVELYAFPAMLGNRKLPA